MFCASNDHRPAHRIRHRTRPETCGLVRKSSFEPTFQLCLRKSANLFALRCIAYVPTAFSWFSHCRPSGRRRGRRQANQNTGFFIKTLQLLCVSEMAKERKNGLRVNTKSHCFDGSSRFRPGLTDADSESAGFRIARRTPPRVVGELSGGPSAALFSLPFHNCRLGDGNSVVHCKKLEIET